jgi:hypothetical protein
MPEIFKKDCKVTVIEYGAHAPDLTFQQIKNQIVAVLNRLFKK